MGTIIIDQLIDWSMRRSDQQQSQLDDFGGNVSLDETANSIHQQNIDQDKDMLALDAPLKQFIQYQLKLELKLDDLEHQYSIFRQKQAVIINPTPSLYFLPHHILVFNRSQSGTAIRDSIQKTQKQKGYTIRYDSRTEQLNIKLHNQAELVYYNIKIFKNDASLHRRKQFLDPRYLIDKLFQYYCCYYQRLHFEETASLILYWAYQKELINEDLSYHALKLIVICNFINFGYGVPNVVNLTMSNPQILKENNKMIAYAKINVKGETQIDQELIKKYVNYTIEEKRGFYMTSKRKFMQIKDIIPITFPIVSLTSQMDAKQTQEARKNIDSVVNNSVERMSLCKNIFKIFKFLHNKFDKRMKLVIDFQEKLAYRHDFAENFQLQVLHPVLSTSVCSIKDQPSIRKIKCQIDNVYDSFVKSSEPLAVLKEMLLKRRN